MKSDYYVYWFIRKDLPVVHQIIQMGHAAFDAGADSQAFGFIKEDLEYASPNACLFEVQSESELANISKQLHKLGIWHRIFNEPDHQRGFTSIATRPIKSDDPLRQFFFNAGFKQYGAE